MGQGLHLFMSDSGSKGRWIKENGRASARGSLPLCSERLRASYVSFQMDATESPLQISNVDGSDRGSAMASYPFELSESGESRAAVTKRGRFGYVEADE